MFEKKYWNTSSEDPNNLVVFRSILCFSVILILIPFDASCDQTDFEDHLSSTIIFIDLGKFEEKRSGVNSEEFYTI